MPERKPVPRAAVQLLESLQRAGVTHLPKAKGKTYNVSFLTAEELQAPSPAPAITSPAPAIASPAAAITSPAVAGAGLPKASAPSTAKADQPSSPRATTSAPSQTSAKTPTPVAVPVYTLETIPGDTLDKIRAQVAQCPRCAELAATRTQTVFGSGNPRARLCFIGEAPGADEDAAGEPFIGRAGQLLTKIIEACQLSRDDVFIANVLKCRPPGNRTPLPDEVANCRGYLDRQLALVRPEFICALGAIAAQTLLETPLSIGRLRGKFHNYRGIPVICTYHPAYLLRNPSAKREVWEDMKMLLPKLGIELP